MHYEIHITEYGKRNGEIVKMTRDAEINHNGNLYQVANAVIDAAFINDGALVRIARMNFDPTTDSFKIEEYKFNVYEEKAQEIVPVN